MIYSIVPYNVIYGGLNKEIQNIEIPCENGVLVLAKSEGDNYSIERLISTKPEMFLNPRLQPGMNVGGIDKLVYNNI